MLRIHFQKKILLLSIVKTSIFFIFRQLIYLISLSLLLCQLSVGVALMFWLVSIRKSRRFFRQIFKSPASMMKSLCSDSLQYFLMKAFLNHFQRSSKFSISTHNARVFLLHNVNEDDHARMREKSPKFHSPRFFTMCYKLFYDS